MKIVELNSEMIKKIPMALLLEADPSESAIESYRDRAKVIAVVEEDRILGVALSIETRPKTYEIINVSVEEAFQGMGLGKRLVMASIDWCKQHGIKTVEIGTGNSSVGQLALYQKCGFRIVGIDTDYFVKHYDEPLFENGIQCRDMMRLRMDL